MIIPIWHKEDGKWYLIPAGVRNRLSEGDKLRYDPNTKWWTAYGPGFMETITASETDGGYGFIKDQWEPK